MEAAILFDTLGDAQLWKRQMIGFNFAVDDDDTLGFSLKVHSDEKHLGRDIQMKWSGYEPRPLGLNIPWRHSILSLQAGVRPQSPRRHGVPVTRAEAVTRCPNAPHFDERRWREFDPKR